jgi:hypothetical protein
MSSVLLGSVLSAACGAAPGTAEEFEESSETEPLGTQSQELSNSTICTLIDELADVSLGDENLGASVTADCTKGTAKELSYLGGTSPAKFSKSVSKFEAKSLYCALKGGDDQVASATWSTGVGSFGTKTRLNVYKSDPVAMSLSAQRVQTIYAFGVGMNIDNQTFAWTSPTEAQPSQTVKVFADDELHSINLNQTLPEQTGQYARGTSNHYNWGVHGKANFPVGPFGVQLNVDFDNKPIFQAGARRAYDMDGISGTLDSARLSSWDTFYDACRVCKATPQTGPIILPCNCPTTAEIYQHYRQCGTGSCNEAFYASTTDGRLPHENRRGAAGPFWDPNNSDMSDFWHWGRPGSGAASSSGWKAAGEPSYSIASNGDGSTTLLDLRLGFKYDVGIAAVNLSVHMDNDWRGGVALREFREPFGDVSGQERYTEVGLDAQAAFGVDARLVINADLPFIGGVTLLDETFDIIKRQSKQSSPKVPGQVIWDENTAGEGVLKAYTAKGVASTLDSCLSVPAVDEAPLEADTPQAFVDAVSDKVPDQLFPCDVTICAPTSTGGTQKKKCNWNPDTGSLACTVVANSCTCLENDAYLCDAAGNKYASRAANNPACFQVPR